MTIYKVEACFNETYYEDWADEYRTKVLKYFETEERAKAFVEAFDCEPDCVISIKPVETTDDDYDGLSAYCVRLDCNQVVDVTRMSVSMLFDEFDTVGSNDICTQNIFKSSCNGCTHLFLFAGSRKEAVEKAKKYIEENCK